MCTMWFPASPQENTAEKACDDVATETLVEAGGVRLKPASKIRVDILVSERREREKPRFSPTNVTKMSFTFDQAQEPA